MIEVKKFQGCSDLIPGRKAATKGCPGAPQGDQP